MQASTIFRQSRPPWCTPPRRRSRGRAPRLMLVPLLAVALPRAHGRTGRNIGRHEGPRPSLADPGHQDARACYLLSTTPVESGLVKTTLHNTGMQPHQAQIGKFTAGEGSGGLQEALTNPNPARSSEFSRASRRPERRRAGGNPDDDQNLDGGDYLVLCFVTDPTTHMPHFAMGMYAPFPVVGPDRHGSIHASQKVYAVDEMRFVLPDELRSARSCGSRTTRRDCTSSPSAGSHG